MCGARPETIANAIVHAEFSNIVADIMGTKKTRTSAKPPARARASKAVAEPSGGASGGYDGATAKRAFDELASRLDAIPESEWAPTTADIELGALAALAVARAVTEPAFYERFASLPRSEFDIADVDDLAQAAWAAWYARRQAAMAGALTQTAKLPAALLDEGNQIEKRMQHVCEYHLSGDAELGREIARLRPGTGYRDLSGDLLAYARIYRKRLAVVRRDKTNYRATDAPRAEAIAGLIIQALSQATTPKQKTWATNLSRAWTLLLQVYGEVAATGLWLRRGDKTAPAHFPSLFTIARRAKNPRAAAKKQKKSSAAPGPSKPT